MKCFTAEFEVPDESYETAIHKLYEILDECGGSLKQTDALEPGVVNDARICCPICGNSDPSKLALVEDTDVWWHIHSNENEILEVDSGMHPYDGVWSNRRVRCTNVIGTKLCDGEFSLPDNIEVEWS